MDVGELAVVGGKVGLRKEQTHLLGEVVHIIGRVENNGANVLLVEGNGITTLPFPVLRSLCGLCVDVAAMLPGASVMVSPRLTAELIALTHPKMGEMAKYAGRVVNIVNRCGNKLEIAEDGGAFVWDTEMMVHVPESVLDPRADLYAVGDKVVLDDGIHTVLSVLVCDGFYRVEGREEMVTFDQILGRVGRAEVDIAKGDLCFVSHMNDGVYLSSSPLAGGHLVEVVGFITDKPGTVLVREPGKENRVYAVGKDYLTTMTRSAGALEWMDWDEYGVPMVMRWRGLVVKAYTVDEWGQITSKGMARCHEDDAEKFDFKFGVKLAKLRAAQAELLKSIEH